VVDGALLTRGGGSIAADGVIALPKLEPPAIAGLPAGFLEIDEHARVVGVPHVYAAGDVTAGAVKQGGLATQQADAAAESIAAEAGADVEPRPYRPVLRGLLLTGDAPIYLRSELSWAHGALTRGVARRLPKRGTVSSGALWWPPAKLAGRHLSAWFASSREPFADQHASARAPDHERAVDLALLMADVAAEEGDVAAALHAIDAAANLSGGVLPVAAAKRRDAWRAQVGR
jgi:sulfide:quinone oxidoreductase